ncbi:MAG: RnfABCDGE type electron transport complex subunit B [Clostridia bacterium]|nr:RnfABCDGE type electron transport complex subunit B [Clostridia bacterium]
MLLSANGLETALEIIYPVAILTVLAIVFAILIAVFSVKFAVKEDERVTAVCERLAGANCGACGYAGCEAFAKALVAGDAQLTACNATKKSAKEEIVNILGSGDLGEETIVVCACNGGNVCMDKYDYQGYGGCASIELLAGGSKACPMGCIGNGTCVQECPHDAIDLVDGVSIVNQEKCVQCGLCISHCPKKILKRIPAKAQLYVACSSCDKGKDVRAYCKAGCIACGLCMRNCEAGAITLKNNIAVIDYDKCTGCKKCAEKCPSKCIKIL